METPADGALLDVDSARRALVKMVAKSDEVALRQSLEALKADPVEEAGKRTVRIGSWYVNLEERTFVVSVIAPPFFAEYSGRFVRDAAAGWTAITENITRN